MKVGTLLMKSVFSENPALQLNKKIIEALEGRMLRASGLIIQYEAGTRSDQYLCK